MTDPVPVRGPLCDQQESIDGDPTGPVLRCHLPAGHRSEEHYDRTFGLAWRHLHPAQLGPDPATPPRIPQPRAAAPQPTTCTCLHWSAHHATTGWMLCQVASCPCSGFTAAP